MGVSGFCQYFTCSISLCFVLVNLSTCDKCGDVGHEVESGVIHLPKFVGGNIENISCNWRYTAPSGLQFLLKVDSVHLPPLDLRSSSLHIYLDDKWFHIPRSCVKCLSEEVSGELLRVVYTSAIIPSIHVNNSFSSDSDTTGAFQIRFKAFDPYVCDRAKTPENGYIEGKERKVGQSIHYKCNPPYELVGTSESHCLISEHSPVPQWTGKTPSCVVPNCNGETVHKRAGLGSIVNPGYASHVLLSSQQCRWEVTAEIGKQIRVTVKWIKFPENQHLNHAQLYLYDGNISSVIANITSILDRKTNVITTRTNKLIVTYSTEADTKYRQEAGFHLMYTSIETTCPDPGQLLNGKVIGYSFTVESSIAFQCEPGYSLHGNNTANCLSNGDWSVPKPLCHQTTSSTEETLNISTSQLNNNSPSFKESSKSKAKAIPAMKEVPQKVPLGSKSKNEQAQWKEQTSPHIKNVEPEDVEHSQLISSKKSGSKSSPGKQQVVPPKTDDKEDLKDDQVVRLHVNPRVQPQPESQLTSEHAQVGETKRGDSDSGLTFTMLMVIVGVSSLVGVLVILVIVVIVYRKKYPVRMRFGRKFSTFENPMYVRKDAQDPKELRHLNPE
ncbi:CUB and sushi domain-containing protein 3-like [Limulus polyphemus]|uniref:CUB and sushi domain-containing protein 3-like n=1 Tax=Limulus polyphemus TaxID=6850 RepID=A0ABM1AZU8_LIMPO|nr:CUB and sushi domain-containing protein 3-like [Limulus polyphemus]